MSNDQAGFIGKQEHWDALQRVCDKHPIEEETEDNAIDFLNDLMHEMGIQGLGVADD